MGDGKLIIISMTVSSIKAGHYQFRYYIHFKLTTKMSNAIVDLCGICSVNVTVKYKFSYFSVTIFLNFERGNGTIPFTPFLGLPVREKSTKNEFRDFVL